MLAAVVDAASDRADMAHRNKNLLEAFSASAASEKAGESLAGNGASSTVGGPFASPPSQESILTPAERELVKDAASGQPAFARNLMRPENFPGLVAAVVILVAVSFMIGRATSGGVIAAAAEPSDTPVESPETGAVPSLAATPIRLPGAQPAVAQRTSEDGDRAETEEAQRINQMMTRLRDRTNRYTVKLVEYRIPSDVELANATFYFLLDQGLPVGMLDRGKRRFIVLGAAAQQVDLDDLLQRAKTMDGPPPRNIKAEFDDAYLEKIDKLLARE